MTDRERLIELLVDSEVFNDADGKADANCLADHLLANGATVQEWISVKDRLPSVGCDVLFVCESKNYGVGAYSDTYRDFFSGQFPVKNVTHWCELPQPPEGVHS